MRLRLWGEDFLKGRSEVPEFKVHAARPQLSLHSQPFYEWTFPDGRLGTEFYRIKGGYLLRFPDLADFEVSGEGLDVSCFPAPHIRDATPEHLYLNQVLPLVLSKIGNYVFHASAVEVSEVSFAFLGESGRGKSTLAANFVTNGHRLLTDDGLILERRNESFQVIPSHPSIRLWEDSQAMLAGMSAEPAAPLHFTTKTRFLAGPGLPYCDQPRPLRAVYFLGDGSARDIVFRRLSPAETLVGWLRNSFLLDVQDRSMLSAHFDRVAALANTLTCYHLDYPRRFDDLDRLLAAILNHAALEGMLA
jgi:hypothetical protein